MSKPFIIGILGYAQVGKSTIAEGLVKRINNSIAVGFADSLKDMTSEVFEKIGLDVKVTEDKIKGRDILVAVGRTARQQDPMFWVKALEEELEGETAEVVIIQDVRYLNEVKWILDQGGVVIRVYRDGYNAANTEEQNSINEVYVGDAWRSFRFFGHYNRGPAQHVIDQAYTLVQEYLPTLKVRECSSIEIV